MTSKRYRYPGSKPFEERERSIFFGRDEDIDMLTRMIRVEPLVVLYGKSGLGKSSLLNAGVVPVLAEKENYEVIPMRFGSYSEGSNRLPPLEQLIHKIKQEFSSGSFLSKVPAAQNTLWFCLKEAQLNEQQPKSFVIVFDQFEELFTYPDRDVRRFKESLVDVLNTALPHELRFLMKERMQSNTLDLSKEEMSLLYEELRVHFVFAIRSDKMSLMNHLRDHIPNILQRVYELLPLTRMQAEDAILSPAEIRDENNEFYSPSFDYEDDALDKILDFLTKGNDKSIESFQLQILCQHVEENLVIKNFDTLISPEDIGDLNHIYQNYYDNQIEKIESEEDRAKARKLIEEGMIFEEEERRLSLYEGQIKSAYGISEGLLRQLASTHIIRSEPHSTGGFSYEISHDTLVGPILRSKERRESVRLEQEKIEKEKKRQEELRQKQRKRYRRISRSLGLIIIILGALFSAYAYFNSNEKNKDLADTLDRLKDALAAQDSIKQLNEQYAKSTQGQLAKQVSLWKERYYSLSDSIQSDTLSAIDTAALRAQVHELTVQRDEWNQRYRSLLNRSSKEKYQYVKRLKALNKELFDELWKTEYKSNQEWLRLKDGIVKKYQEFEKEVE